MLNRETLATYNETAYLDFISDFIKLEEQSNSLTPLQLYQETLKVISPLGTDESNFFKLSLAIHEASPRIEAYNQLYHESVTQSLVSYDESCDTWVQVGNKQYCDFKIFSEAMHKDHGEATEIEVLPFDHVVYSKQKAAPTIVIYTSRFSSQFGEFYNYLVRAATFHDLSFIIRYKPSLKTPGSPLYLSGYGVEMVLKKTDYLVIDDRSSQSMSVTNYKTNCCLSFL
jgi:UDP-glucose:glycoprotein glucosyltransferase